MSFEIKRARGKTAVYSGARQHSDYVPRLEDLCIQKLLDNINRIECVGDVPYYILRPLLTRISVAQLKHIESYNPKIVDDDDSDEPWKAHCERDFPGRKLRDGWKWRDLYTHCERERNQKIEKITKRIKRHGQAAKPTRQAKIVDQELPVGTTHGVSSKTVITKTIKNSVRPSGSQQSGPSSSKTIVIRREINNGSQSKTSATKAKAAPLMQKSMQLFKSRFRR